MVQAYIPVILNARHPLMSPRITEIASASLKLCSVSTKPAQCTAAEIPWSHQLQQKMCWRGGTLPVASEGCGQQDHQLLGEKGLNVTSDFNTSFKPA